MSIFGFQNAAEYEKAINAELEQINSHSNRDGARPGQHTPKAQPRRSRGSDQKITDVDMQRHAEIYKTKAGSPERMRKVREIAPDLFDELSAEQAWNQLQLLVQHWENSERQDLDEQVVGEIARLSWATQNPGVFHAARDAIFEIAGEELLGRYDTMIATKLQNEDARVQEQLSEAVGNHYEGIHTALEDEYRVVERKLGPAGLEAVDEIAQIADAEGVLYHPETDPETLRVSLRAAAEAQAAGERARDNLFTHAELDREFKRAYGPAGADEDRREWEARVDDATIEVYDRDSYRARPEQAVERAFAARALETADKTPFETALDEEFARLSSHSNEAEHRVALREANVADYERTHDDAGRSTTRDF